MTTIHLIASGLGLVATVLYLDRTIWLAKHGTTQTGISLVARMSTAAVLASVTYGFLDLALSGAPFVTRHAFVAGALLVFCVGHIGMRGTAAT